MAADDPQTRLRFPPDMKAKLEEEAQKNARSLNAEVVARLQHSLSPSNELNDVLALRRMVGLLENIIDAKEDLIKSHNEANRGNIYFWRQAVEDLLTEKKLTDRRRKEYEKLLDQLNRALSGSEKD